MKEELPMGLTLHRRTDEFDPASVPRGLLRSHRIGRDVWGVLCVRAGTLRFIWEGATGPEATVELGTGDSVVIPPEVPHRVEPGPDSRFVVEFYR